MKYYIPSTCFLNFRFDPKFILLIVAMIVLNACSKGGSGAVDSSNAGNSTNGPNTTISSTGFESISAVEDFDYGTVKSFDLVANLTTIGSLSASNINVDIYASDTSAGNLILTTRSDENGVVSESLEIGIHVTKLILMYTFDSVQYTQEVSTAAVTKINQLYKLFVKRVKQILSISVYAQDILPRYFPAKCNYGTLLFEDLWPQKGDYDFNDLVIRYNYKINVNASKTVESLEAEFYIDATGAGFTNGFGIELDLPSIKISSISGQELS